MSSKVYRGVDVSKQHLDVDGQVKPIVNDGVSVRAFVAALPPEVHLVCESSGGYEQTLLKAAWELQRPISVIVPARVRAFAHSFGQYAKTDRLDRELLTAFGKERAPVATPPPHPVRQRVRALLRAREHLLELELLEKNHREHLAEEPLLRDGSTARLELLASQRKQIEEKIAEIIAADAATKAQIARLRQMKGVGRITAWTVWADLPELGSLRAGQAAALCGLAPYPDDSGTRNGARHIRYGRATLRRVLYMAAVTASQHNPVLKPFYERLRARGKPAKVALMAVARRMIETLNLLLKNPHFQLA